MSASAARPNRWTVLAVLLFLQVTSSGLQISVAIAGVKLLESSGYGWQAVSLVLGALSLGITVGLVPWGRISDKYSERRALLWGFSGAVVGLVLCTLFVNHVVLVVTLASTGFFLAASISGGSALLRLSFPFHQRGLAFGIRMTGGPIGGVIASIVAPLIIQISVAALFLTFAAVAAVAVVLIFFLIPVIPAHDAETGSDTRSLFIGSPVRYLVYKIRPALMLALISGIAQVSFVFTVTIGPQFLDQNLRLDGAQIGYVMAIGQIGGGVGRLLVGRLADRSRTRTTVAVATMTLVLLGALGIVVASGASSWVLLTMFCATSMLTQSVSSVLMAMTTEVSRQKYLGISVGIQQTAIGIVASLGPLALGWIVAQFGWGAAGLVVCVATFAGWALLTRMHLRVRARRAIEGS